MDKWNKVGRENSEVLAQSSNREKTKNTEISKTHLQSKLQ